MGELIDNLRTIPGVADKTILALLAECGNLDRFYAPKALIGFLPDFLIWTHTFSYKSHQIAFVEYHQTLNI
jgi:5'-3' exonuclease